MLIVAGNRELERTVASAVKSITTEADGEAKRFLAKYRTVAELTAAVEELKIEKGRREEEFAKREREVEHKVGLERKRQAFEIEQAKRETEVNVREENLKADKERFKAEMDFQRKRLEEEVSSLRELVGQMLQRLPSAEIAMEIHSGKRRAS
jgi:hypothetical protein